MRKVVVVGAGPGGSVGAIALARRGWGLVLVDQDRFPREKVCGECLSATGMGVLRRVGSDDAVRREGAVRMGRVVVHAPGGSSAEARLPGAMWGVSRGVLDRVLIDAAAKAGVVVRQRVRCEGIEGGRPVRVVLRELETNRVEHVTADWVLLGDGKAGLMPRRPGATGDLGVKAHFAGVEGAARDAIELFGFEGHYAGLAPVEGGRWNLAMSVPAERVRRCRGEFDELLEDLLGENRALGRRLAKAERVGEWLATPLPRFGVVRHWPAGVVPVGNAAAALEPIGGEGMGLALRSAELAAAAVDEAERIGSDGPVRQLRKAYQRLWGVRRVACRAGAMVVSRPGLCDAAVVAMRISPPLRSLFLHLCGKRRDGRDGCDAGARALPS